MDRLEDELRCFFGFNVTDASSTSNRAFRNDRIDTKAGTITINHGPVPTLDWPAMTMAFEANKALRQRVAVGEVIAFEFQTGPKSSVITSIAEQ